MKDVVIVGGGVAGLAAALRLKTLGVEATLVERERRLGGKILTERAAGFVVEAAADSFLSRKPRGVGLCRELGIEGRLIGRREEHRRSFVKWQGALVPLPEGLSGMVPADERALAECSLLSEEGKRRFAREREIPPSRGEGDESLASFFTRRFGSETYERLIEPLASGIYGADGEGVSLEATFPQLGVMERTHGSLLKGMRAAAAAGPAEPAPLPPFVSFAAGMGELPDAIAAELGGVPLLTSMAACSVAGTRGGYRVTLDSGESLETRCAILAVPAPRAAELVEGLDADLAARLAAIRYSSVVVASLAFEERSLPAPLEGAGYLVPRAERGRVLACTFASNKWPGRAPAGTVLVRVFVGGATDGGPNPVGDAREELRRTLGVRAAPLRIWVHTWPYGLPLYRVGHLERLGPLEQRLAGLPGLEVAGASYHGLGVPDCIASGEQAAERAAAWLGRVDALSAAAAARGVAPRGAAP